MATRHGLVRAGSSNFCLGMCRGVSSSAKNAAAVQQAKLQSNSRPSFSSQPSFSSNNSNATTSRARPPHEVPPHVNRVPNQQFPARSNSNAYGNLQPGRSSAPNARPSGSYSNGSTTGKPRQRQPDNAGASLWANAAQSSTSGGWANASKPSAEPTRQAESSSSSITERTGNSQSSETLVFMEEDGESGKKPRTATRLEYERLAKRKAEEAAQRQGQGQKSKHDSIKRALKAKQLEKKTRDVYLPKTISVGNLARALGVRLDPLQTALYKAGFNDTNYDHLLTAEDAALIAPDFGCNAIINEDAAFDIYPPTPAADVATLPIRPPVVTIMGHVDHGKTTLLDKLRSASVAKGEAGGITQHIGAFSLPVSSLSTSQKRDSDDRLITFLDTPGHAAFSAMRARGARVTDIVVLVVAADDGVMPQTKEVINLVNQDESGIGLVVAINKVDKFGADVDQVKNMLLAEGVALEGYGGDVPVVEVSGLTGHGLDNLMETISLVSELMELRAEKEGAGVGYVLESKIAKGLGPVATVLLLRGSLQPGSHIIAGTVGAKVRQLTDHNGKVIKSASPGTAFTIAGWRELPQAGDEVIQGKSEDEVKKAIANRKRQKTLTHVVEDIDAINAKRRAERDRREAHLAGLKAGTIDPKQAVPMVRPENPDQQDQTKRVKLIIKSDVMGSSEAVAGALEGIGNDKVKSSVVSSTVGDVTEGDIDMAKAIGGCIVAFGVNIPKPIMQMAISQEVPIMQSTIIYRLMESVTAKVISYLPTTTEMRVHGEAIVQQQFEINLKGRQILKVAGCKVTNGIVEKSRQARLVRGGKTIYESSLDTFKHHKKDVTEMRKGTECGMGLLNYSGDFLPGDVIQMFETIEKPGVL